MKTLLLLLPVALATVLSACASGPTTSYSTVAHKVGVEGPTLQEQPETLAQWKVLAERMAGQAASQLQGVIVSPRAIGMTSAFDLAFHDFFVSALHDRGVILDEQGARVEIDTYPLAFVGHDTLVRNHDGMVGVAPPLELGVNVRILAGSRLVFSGSQTYYLPAADYHNYRTMGRQHNGTRVRVVGE